MRDGGKRRLAALLALSVSLTLHPSLGAEVGALTLDGCYRLALERSETLALGEEEIRRAEGRYEQVRAAALPRLGARGTYLYQDTTGVNTGSNSTFTRAERPEARLYARQALFSGFRELAARRAGKALVAREDLEHRRARQLLYQDVASAYYAVVALDARLETLRSLKQSSLDRLKELKERLGIGRSRRSELLSAQSQLASLDAALVEARGLRLSALELLSFLIGKRAAAVKDDRPFPQEAPALEAALGRLPSRPDLLAAARAAEAADHSAAAARRERWPTVGAEGSYYLKRVGFNEPIDWDVVFSADAPLYTGGAVRGAVKEAESLRRAAALERGRALRLAEEDLRSVHNELATALERAGKLRIAAEAAAENYEAQTKDYRLGLVDNLDVLTALTDLYNARLEYDRARVEAKLNAVRLAVAAGDLEEEPR